MADQYTNIYVMTYEQEISIIEKRKNKIPLKKIMEEYSIKSVKTIYDIIKRNGVKKIGNKKYSVNENYFEKIDTEEKAYWLGFLYADGYVRMKYGRSGQLKLKLQTSDKDHIFKFKNSIDCDSGICDNIDIFSGKNDKKYTSYNSTLNVYNTKMVLDLIRHGCVNNKTQKIRFPNIEIHLISHFIRGYFDGDGCISKLKKSENIFHISICSNDNFIKDLFNILNIGNILKEKNYSLLIINKMLDIKFFKNFIYKDANVFLERKFIKFNLIKEYSDDYYLKKVNNFKKEKFKL